MIQLTSAEQKRYDPVADIIMVYEAYIEKPFAISILCDIFDEVMHSKVAVDFSKLRENQSIVRDLFNVGRDRIEIKDRVYAAMRDIAQFFRQESLVDILTKIALIHYQFEMLRPFPSLNGVIGRMGISMLLFKAGFRAAPFLCISDFLLQNMEAYFSQLSSTQRNGDYLSWIKFMLFSIPFTSLKAQTSNEKSCVPSLFDL